MNKENARLVIGVVGAVVLALCLCLTAVAGTETIMGTTGSSSQWGSGWMVLAPPMDFAKGDKLRVTLGGTAKKIVLRLLPKNQSPDSSAGVVGGPIDVPANRVVEVVLTEDRKQVSQISVHGGPNPWNEYDLGGNNGPATIKVVERTKQK